MIKVTQDVPSNPFGDKPNKEVPGFRDIKFWDVRGNPGVFNGALRMITLEDRAEGTGMHTADLPRGGWNDETITFLGKERVPAILCSKKGVICHIPIAKKSKKAILKEIKNLRKWLNTLSRYLGWKTAMEFRESANEGNLNDQCRLALLLCMMDLKATGAKSPRNESEAAELLLDAKEKGSPLAANIIENGVKWNFAPETEG